MESWNYKILVMLLIGSILMVGVSIFGLSNESNQSIPLKNNLVVNGGFEDEIQSGARLPSGWGDMWDVASSPDHCKMSVDTERKYEGKQSLKLVFNPPDKNGISTGAVWQKTSIDPSQRYDFSCAIRSELEKGGICFSVRWMDTNGQLIKNEKDIQITHNKSIYGSFKLNQTPEWEILRFEHLAPPPGAVSAYIGIHPVGEAKGLVWVDDFYCKIIESIAKHEKMSPVVTIGKMEEKLMFDGKLDEKAWSMAAEVNNFTIPQLYAPANQNTIVKLAFDNENIYMFLKMLEPEPGKIIAKCKEKDSPVYSDDNIELFFAPNGANAEQFHILVNPAGTVYDIKEKWHNVDTASKAVDMDDSWDSSIKVSSSIDKNYWNLELAIPFSKLNRPVPKEGEIWEFNICRTRRAGGGLEQSSWAPLKELVFQNPNYWGKLIFSSKKVLINSLEVSPAALSIGIFNPCKNEAEIMMDVVEDRGIKNIQLLQNKEKIPSKTSQTLNLAMGGIASSNMLWYSLYENNNLIFREGFVACKNYAKIGWDDPEGILGNTIYLANNMPSFKGFQINHNFLDSKANGLIERKQKPVDLYFELPKGVVPSYLSLYIVDWMTWPPIKAIKTDIPCDNGNIVYKFELPAILNFPYNYLYVVFENSLPENMKKDGAMYLSWAEAKQPRHKFTIESISIGKIVPFENFVSNIYEAPPEFYLSWLKKPCEELPQLGFNLLEVSPMSRMLPERKQFHDKLIPACSKKGLFVTTAPCQSTPLVWKWTRDDASARALDINGKPVIDERFGTYVSCPSYRGNFYKEHIEDIEKVFIEYKLSWLSLDLELWSDEAWSKCCFCDRCINKFKDFISREHADIKLNNPIDDLKNKDSKIYKLWLEYKERSKAEFYSDFKKHFEKIVADNNFKSSPRNGLTFSDWHLLNANLAQSVNSFDLNLYFRPLRVSRRLDETINFAKNKNLRKSYMGTLCAGPNDSILEINKLAVNEVRYNIFECAAAGVQGIRWWHLMGFDAMRLKTIVEAYNSIRPFEDIILNGKYLENIKIRVNNAETRGLELAGEFLILIKDYSTLNPLNVEVSVPVNTDSIVVDCYTLEKLADVTPVKNIFNVKIDSERARLLYIGPKNKWQERIDKYYIKVSR